MTITFEIPSEATFAAWHKGQVVTDEQLQELGWFYYSMMTGMEALGMRFALATESLRYESMRLETLRRLRDGITAVVFDPKKIQAS